MLDNTILLSPPPSLLGTAIIKPSRNMIRCRNKITDNEFTGTALIGERRLVEHNALNGQLLVTIGQCHRHYLLASIRKAV